MTLTPGPWFLVDERLLSEEEAEQVRPLTLERATALCLEAHGAPPSADLVAHVQCGLLEVGVSPIGFCARKTFRGLNFTSGVLGLN